MTSKEQLTIEQLEYYRNTYERYDGIESNIFERICNELIDFKKSKTYILDECIKEWNAKGFDVDIYAVEIVIYKPSSVDKEEDEIEISIRLDNKIISYVNDVELSFDLHNLIHKTIKALEEMKDE